MSFYRDFLTAEQNAAIENAIAAAVAEAHATTLGEIRAAANKLIEAIERNAKPRPASIEEEIAELMARIEGKIDRCLEALAKT